MSVQVYTLRMNKETLFSKLVLLLASTALPNAPNEHTQTSTICTDSLSLHSALASNDRKDKGPLMIQIKKKMFELQHSTTVLRVPSHCSISGNDKADELARTGSELPQDNVRVTDHIMKAKIKSRGWPITHPTRLEDQEEMA